MRLTGLVVSLLCVVSFGVRAQAPSPVGVWRTFDDQTGLERGAVRISERSGELIGVIVRVLDPKDADKICIFCSDERKDKRILGLTIITGMRLDGESWSGGRILDPENGSIYRSSMRLVDNGRTLIVRGYVGISLLGRSQTWRRAE